jgi:hypothetical protein
MEIKERLITRGPTKDEILNSSISTLAKRLLINYYVALLIHNSARK